MGGTLPGRGSVSQLEEEPWPLPTHLHLGVRHPSRGVDTLTVSEGPDVEPPHKEEPLIPREEFPGDQEEPSAATLVTEALVWYKQSHPAKELKGLIKDARLVGVLPSQEEGSDQRRESLLKELVQEPQVAMKRSGRQKDVRHLHQPGGGGYGILPPPSRRADKKTSS